ncbi:hypothetical protein SUNI508_00523 [Seiridium unicorne]|uniref:Uncharacterized protein n=1 Tax=Seiridium unicorne TaxID=138068 RepID=A0ABR2V6X6_9PEZI
MPSFWKGMYDKVKDEKHDADTEDELSSLTSGDHHGRHPQFLGSRRVVGILASALRLVIIVSAANLWYSIGHTYSVPRAQRHQEQCQQTKPQRVCGNTAAEALSLGCTLDQMTWSWLSPSCPRYASSDFESAENEPFRYYVDPHNAVLAEGSNWTLALDNQVRLYTERREHVTHCMYTFLSLAQIIRDGTETHPRLSSYEHIHHCVKVVLESVRRDKDWFTIDADMGEVSFDEGC